MFLLLILSSGLFFTETNTYFINNASILESCINSVLESIKQDKKCVYVVNTDVRIKNFPIVFYNRSSKISRKYTILPDIYVVSGNVTDVLNVLYKSKMLVNTNYFVFILQKVNQELKSALKRYFIYKVLLIALNTANSYYEINRISPVDHQVVDICPNPQDLKLKTRDISDSLYREKKFLYINVLYDIDPPFVISDTEGIHIEFLKIISENIKVKLNFIKTQNPTVVTEVSPEFTQNLTYDLYAAPLASTFQAESLSFDLTIRFTEDKLVFITPNILITNQWAIFYGEFKNGVWTYFIILLITLSIVICLIDYLVPEKKSTNILSFIVSVLFEGTVTIYSKKTSITVLFITYQVFVLIFTTIYRSQMFDIMRKDNAYNPIKRRMDIPKFNFKACLPDKFARDKFRLSHDPIEYYIGWREEMIIGKNYWECINMTAYDKNTVTLRTAKALEYVVPHSYLDENGFPLINILKKDFHYHIYFMFAFRKGHPLLNTFNKKILTLHESGFVEYESKIYKRQFEKAKATADKKRNFYFKALTLDILESVFFVYIALICICCLVFCLELVLGRQLLQKETKHNYPYHP
ncbi:Ionotropic receptor 124 [Diabrotica virgifera virgifera]|nr:Ionotropic receptor 124 [Diabrotica virgifera virgifera]